MLALTCNDDFDFEFTNDGLVSIEKDTGASLANMLKLEFACNDDWELDNALGIHWLNKDNTGLMQTKNNEVQIVSAIQRKLYSMDEVREVKQIDINKGLGGNLFVSAIVIAKDGTAIQLGREVSQ